MTFLIHLGYLAYNPSRKTVYIPNEEVRQAMVDAVQFLDEKRTEA